MSTDALGITLLALARNAIAAPLGQPAPAAEIPSMPELTAPGATFVTLTQDGILRGCIGSLSAHRALADDVFANAQAAAFRDPRFPPLAVDELATTRIEVSLLDPSEPLPCTDEAEAIARKTYHSRAGADRPSRAPRHSACARPRRVVARAERISSRIVRRRSGRARPCGGRAR